MTPNRTPATGQAQSECRLHLPDGEYSVHCHRSLDSEGFVDSARIGHISVQQIPSASEKGETIMVFHVRCPSGCGNWRLNLHPCHRARCN